jgi:hypothetical protein
MDLVTLGWECHDKIGNDEAARRPHAIESCWHAFGGVPDETQRGFATERTCHEQSDQDWLLSQPQRSLARDFGCSRKCRHFRRLAAKRLVSGAEFWESRTKGRKSRGKSLLDEFSISEIFVWERAETGCVFTETGSKPAKADLPWPF